MRPVTTEILAGSRQIATVSIGGCQGVDEELRLVQIPKCDAVFLIGLDVTANIEIYLLSLLCAHPMRQRRH